MDCKNCKNQLLKSSNYCNTCGAKVINKRLTIKNLFIHFSEQFFNYDNTLFKTIKHLIISPELVIDSFVSGIRKRYMNPVSFFAISITVAGLLIFIVRRFFADQFSMDFMTASQENPFIKDPNDIFEFQTLISILSIPVIAFISKIVFFNIKKYNYTEHLIIYMYTGSLLTFFNFFISLVVLSFGVNFFIYTNIFNIVMILFNAYCLKRIFNLSLKGIILRTFGFLFLVLLFFIAIVIIGVIVGFLSKYLSSP